MYSYCNVLKSLTTVALSNQEIIYQGLSNKHMPVYMYTPAKLVLKQILTWKRKCKCTRTGCGGCGIRGTVPWQPTAFGRSGWLAILVAWLTSESREDFGLMKSNTVKQLLQGMVQYIPCNTIYL